MAFAVGVDGLVTIGANALPLDGFMRQDPNNGSDQSGGVCLIYEN